MKNKNKNYRTKCFQVDKYRPELRKKKVKKSRRKKSSGSKKFEQSSFLPPLPKTPSPSLWTLSPRATSTPKPASPSQTRLRVTDTGAWFGDIYIPRKYVRKKGD